MRRERWHWTPVHDLCILSASSLTITAASIIRTLLLSCNRSIKALNDKTLLISGYTVWVKKNPPPEDLWHFFQNDWEFFNQILRAYYAFLFTLDFEFLFNYLQLWRSFAILSVTAQFTSCAQNVHGPSVETHDGIFCHFSQTGILVPNFTRLLNVQYCSSARSSLECKFLFNYLQSPLAVRL